jgi:hypothetical protein
MHDSQAILIGDESNAGYVLVAQSGFSGTATSSNDLTESERHDREDASPGADAAWLRD